MESSFEIHEIEFAVEDATSTLQCPAAPILLQSKLSTAEISRQACLLDFAGTASQSPAQETVFPASIDSRSV